MGWTVLAHRSSRVAFEVYQGVLDKVAELLPCGCRVVFTADRGFADTPLLEHLARLGWHWRIRITGSFGVYRHGKRHCQVKRMPLALGQAIFWPHVYLTTQEYGPVHLARGRPQASQAYWCVVSDEPTEAKTCEAYGWRFDLEENCLDDQSNGFPLESSLLRSVNALERLCGVWAITTLYLVSQGTAVVAQGKRRWVDPHGFRGQSSRQIGWRGVQLALSRSDGLTTRLQVSAEADPEPALASNIQHQRQLPRFFALEFQDAVAQRSGVLSVNQGA